MIDRQGEFGVAEDDVDSDGLEFGISGRVMVS